MSIFSSGPNYGKLKTNLRLVINRLKLLQKKKTEIALKARKEIADYIAAGKEDRARIRVEMIVREDYMVEAMELIEMYCDLLIARFGLIQSQSRLDPGLEEAIATLIWVAPRLQSDVQELDLIAKQLAVKYSKEFAQACLANSLNNVNEKVVQKMGVQAPPKSLVEKYMVEIARSFNVPFEPDTQVLNSDSGPTGGDLINLDGSSRGGSGGGSFEAGPLPSKPSFDQSEMSNYPRPPLPLLPPMGPPINPPMGFYPSHEGPPYPTNCQQMPHGQIPNSDEYGTVPFGSLPPSYTESTTSDKPEPPCGPAITPSAPNNILYGNLNLPDLPSHSPGSSVAPGRGGPGSTANTGRTDDLDFDDLSRRFEELKRRK